MLGLKSLLKGIEGAYEKNLPFVAYRAPNDTLVKTLIQKDTYLHLTEKFNESGFVFAPFDMIEDTVLIPFNEASYAEAILEQTAILSNDFYTEPTNDMAKGRHLDLVNKGIEYIENGAVEKIVLSRKEVIEISNFSPIANFRKLLNTYQNALVYLWYHPKKGLWLGATPEKLISVSEAKFNTVSLAGTKVFQGNDTIDWGTKEIEEQQIVTRYITSNLEPIVRDIFTGDLTTIKAGNLLHLSTEISGTLKDASDLHLAIQQLHPTPAVCGMPKLAAKKFILEHEDYSREFYTGFLGEINRNAGSNLFVNLRCMKVEHTILNLFLGGGITQDSVAESEWLETVEKSKVMKRVLRN